MKRTLPLIALLLSLLMLNACKEPPNPWVPLRMSLLNYTEDYIDEVYVDGTWAANVFPHGGGSGSTAGSTAVPREWDPNFTLPIKWRTSGMEEDSIVEHQRDVATEPYQKADDGQMANLWIAFFPDGVVKLYPTWVGPGHPDFPEGLLSPKIQCRKQFPDDDRCESPWHRKPKQEVQP